jgi:site-specific recombinase XerD
VKNKKDLLFLRQLGNYFDTFLPEIRQVKEKTVASYADSFAIFFQFLYESKGLQHDRVTYAQLTPALFDEFLLWMKNERGYSAASIRNRMAAISSFLKYASRREMRAVSAYTNADTAELPDLNRTEFPYFTTEEMGILLALPDPDKYLGDRDLVLLSLLYEAGARAQEICDLCVGNIRFGKPTKVKLRGKKGKVREIAISDDVSDLLRYHLKQQWLNGAESKPLPLFSSQTNEHMTTACIRSIVAKYVNMAKEAHPKLFLEKSYSPHSFRHSKAVHMVEAGVNLIYIRNYLGHKSVSSTEIYARVGQNAVNKALTERKIPKLTAAAPKAKTNPCALPDFINRARK